MSSVDLVTPGRIVIEHSPLAFAVTQGETHQLRYVNAAFRRLTDAAADHLLRSQSFAEMFPASGTDGSLALLDRVWRTGQAERISEVERRRPRRPLRRYGDPNLLVDDIRAFFRNLR